MKDYTHPLNNPHSLKNINYIKDMKEYQKWCCINDNFGSEAEPYILEESMKYKRTDSIAWFINGTSKTWRHWKTIGWKCVKVKVSISILTTLFIILALAGCKDGPSYEQQRYHFDETNKLTDITETVCNNYIDSIIKYQYSNRVVAKRMIDSARKYNDIGRFLLKNNPIPKP